MIVLGCLASSVFLLRKEQAQSNMSALLPQYLYRESNQHMNVDSPQDLLIYVKHVVHVVLSIICLNKTLQVAKSPKANCQKWGECAGV